MKKIIFAFLCFISFFCYLSPYAYADSKTPAKKSGQSLDQIVAVVNDDIITKSQLDHAVALVKLQMTHTQVAMPAADVLRKQVLEQMIDKKLQLQIAKLAGVKTTDADVNKAIKHIAERNRLSVEEFYDRLRQENVSISDYRNELREQITLQKIQQQEVVPRITITPEEVSSFTKSKMWQDNQTKEYHLEDVLIPLPDSPSPEQVAAAKKRAQTVVAELRQGTDMQTIMTADSSSPLQGGDLGWRKLLDMPAVFAEKVILLQPKEVATPIQTSNGFHVIRLVAIQNVSNQNKPDRKQIEELIFQRKFDENLRIWISKLRAQAFIEVNLK
ncbi:MAG TPA: SurA N-terminal domain-containing protein [Gammaproteobacteria bacterium]|jgi:peptidyl-prolyl cis-trans isomerase SurA|nr:SurA N-terminal domain-containing protein [Gammaproteobacteria bacterium]